MQEWFCTKAITSNQTISNFRLNFIDINSTIFSFERTSLSRSRCELTRFVLRKLEYWCRRNGPWISLKLFWFHSPPMLKLTVATRHWLWSALWRATLRLEREREIVEWINWTRIFVSCRYLLHLHSCAFVTYVTVFKLNVEIYNLWINKKDTFRSFYK